MALRSWAGEKREREADNSFLSLFSLFWVVEGASFWLKKKETPFFVVGTSVLGFTAVCATQTSSERVGGKFCMRSLVLLGSPNAKILRPSRQAYTQRSPQKRDKKENV